jgi:predicted permease
MHLDTLLQDLRYALRTFRRDASFAAFAVLIVGLGIGASTTVFSVVDTLLLRPPPFERAERLVWITNHDASGLSAQTTQVGHLLDLRQRTRTLSAVAGYFAFYGVGDNLLTGTGEPERLNGVPVSDNFFQVLGVRPLIGRFFTPEECAWNGPDAVVLGHGLWQRRFASDPHVIGSSLRLNDRSYTVVGVLPASFDFGAVFAPGSRIDLFFPFPLSQETNRFGNTMAMIGRLGPGTTVDQVGAELRVLGAQLTREHPERNSFEGFARPLADHVTGRVRLALWVLAGAVALVMLIVCANLSNLLLARAAVRQKEIAIRAALGAGRRRLAAQMLTEGLVLSCSGGLLGLLLALAGTRLLSRLDAVGIPLLATVRPDATTLGFTLALAVGTGLVFGLAPALQSEGAALHDALRDATRGSTQGRRRTWVRSALVVSEIAFACVLLVGAGLLIRSLVSVLDVRMGFEPSHAATIRVDPDRRHATPEQRNAYLDDVLQRVRAIPGVEGAAITDALPLGRNRTWGTRAKGVVYERGRAPTAFVRIVSDGYAAAMGMAVLAGRDISPHDTASSEPVIVVNETMARMLWPGQNAVDRIMIACGAERRVVGVVGDVRHLALELASGNEMYLPMRQCSDQISADLVFRSKVPPPRLAGAVRAALRPIVPNQPAGDFRPLQQLVDASVSSRRFLVLLLAGFAGFAVVLASLGIYALVSYSVSQRTQEIGIRLALGAPAGGVRGRILAQTLLLALGGMVAGSTAAWATARLARGLLFGVTPADPGTFGAVLIVLAAVAAAAGYLPARRASLIDPVIALRAE